jgi:hypothetical protein
MSDMKKSADGWNRVLDLVTRQGVDRRWQTAYPQNDRNERRFVMTHDNRTSTRTYKERRKK